MTKTVPYQAWLHWDPTSVCNLSCAYCFIRTDTVDAKIRIGKRTSFLFRRKKRTSAVSPIQIDKALQTLAALQKTLRVSFTGGGEPFMVPNLALFCGELAKKHYLSFNTNLTSPQIKELTKKVPADKVIYIIASLHYYELQKRGLFATYIRNYQLCRDAGYDLRAKEVAHPLLKDDITFLRQRLQHEGIVLAFEPFIGYHNGKKYPEAYTQEEIDLFNLEPLKDKPSFFHSKVDLCNAGYNIAYINQQGDVYQCPGVAHPIGNVYTKITFNTVLTRCLLDFCACPMKHYDDVLFEQALQQQAGQLLAESRKP